MCNSQTTPVPPDTASSPAGLASPPRDGIPARLAAWCALLRLPNLFTVPGDPLAGGCLAAATLGAAPAWSALQFCLPASLCLYAAGLLANDYLDRAEDTRERPDRPLPSGRISPSPVLFAAILLTVAGVVLAAAAGGAPATIALLLALAVWSYNLGVKRSPWMGPLLMGGCRALSLLLGAATLGLSVWTSPAVIASAVALGLFIAQITRIARDETRSVPVTFRAVSVPPLVLLLWLGALNLLSPANGWSFPPARPGPFALLLAAMPVIWTALLAVPLAGQPAPAFVQRTIGGLIRGLILVQAAVCAATGRAGEIPALVLLAAFAVSGWVGKWIKGS